MKNPLLAGALLMAIGHTTQAAQVDIDLQVDATDNLYFTNWHNVYVPTSDPVAPCGSDPISIEFNCPVGVGTAPELVSQGGNGYNFSDVNSVSFTASGTVLDDGGNATGPDGGPEGEAFGLVHQLDAYSLIGIWSSTADEITPIGINFDDPSLDTARFVIGNGLIDLIVPDGDSVFLFLAENDGFFSDNSGFYNVTVSFEDNLAAVPLPASALLFGTAVLGLLGMRRKHR